MSSSTGEKKRKIGVDDADETSDEVFEYTGKGQTVPKDVVSVRFHPSVVEIEVEAFKNCTKLQEVVLNVGLEQIGQSAFERCNSLHSITLPSTVTEIGDCVFYGCNNLREVVLNDGIKKFGNSIFVFCKSLRSIKIPSDIGNFAFCACRNLREVVLNDGIKKIGLYTFHKCTSLRSIKLPSAVVEIEPYAFSDCTELRDVVIHNQEVQIDDKTFYNCASLQRFKFPGLYTRLDNIIRAGQRGIEAKMDDILTVEWRAGELIIPSVRREIEDQRGTEGEMETLVELDKEKMDKIVKLIRYYEIKEATTLFELALWKAKIDQQLKTDREACRLEVPGPVKDVILQYLN